MPLRLLNRIQAAPWRRGARFQWRWPVSATARDRGTILEYAQRFQKARESDERVVIDGKCLSACTMVIGMVPRDHVCVTPKAVLGFHAAFRVTETGTLVASTDATKFMMDAYPPAVRKWIRQRGGLTNQMVFLSGSELAAFVPSCPTASAAGGFSGLGNLAAVLAL
jgi:hypothetical protein